MRQVILIGVAALAFAGTAQAANLVRPTKAPPTKAQQLQSYLAAVHPIATKVRVAQVQEALRLKTMIQANGVVDTAPFRDSCRQLGLGSNALKKVQRPAFLAEPHAALVGAWRYEAIACARFADAIDGGGNGSVALAFSVAFEKLRGANETGWSEERHWRSEVIAQLRRLGLVVPLWIQQVGR
jgi:hypothetical protein